MQPTPTHESLRASLAQAADTPAGERTALAPFLDAMRAGLFLALPQASRDAIPAESVPSEVNRSTRRSRSKVSCSS